MPLRERCVQQEPALSPPTRARNLSNSIALVMNFAQRAVLHPGECSSGRDAAIIQVVTHLV